MATKSRLLSRLIEGDGSIKTTQIDSDAIGTSAAKSITTASGTTIYSSADTLPASAAAGDQAFVSSTNRLYIFNGSGWYNIALINSTPYWSAEASSTYSLSTNGAATVITILAIDSEGIPITYTAVTDSDFDTIATISKDSDNGRTFTIIPTDSENGTAISGTGTITFRASDGVNLVSTLSTFSLTFITIVANSAETTILLKADTAETDNQADASTNNHTITENGNVTSTAFSPYHPGGYSTYFDGTGDYLSVPGAAFALSTGSFTIETWVYFDSITTGTVSNDFQYMIYDARSGGTPTNHFWAITTSGDVRIRMDDIRTIELDQTLKAGTWYHLALVNNSGTATLYLDGTAQSTTFTTNDNLSIGSVVEIGGDLHNNNYYLDGYLRDFRVVIGTAVYTSNFTPPTEQLTAIANTSLLTCHLPYIADGSSNNHAITTNGNASTKRFSPYDYLGYAKADHGGSVYFDGGTSTRLTLPSDTGFAFGLGAYTVEAWIYISTSTSGGQIFDAGAATGSFSYLEEGGQLKLSKYGVGPQIASSAGAVNTNQWHHCAIVRTSTGANDTRLYVDGVLVGTGTDANNWTVTTTPSIGGANFANYTLNGYISDLRIVKGTAVYTTAFTPPTAPLTAITNTQLLTCTNKNDIWDASTGNLFTKAGNTTASNTQRKFISSSAIYFDGSGDYVIIDGNLAPSGTENFTIESWIYIPTHKDYNYIFSSNFANQFYVDSQGYMGMGSNDEDNFTTYIVNTGGLSNPAALSTNTWYHVAYVRNGSSFKVYVNGTEYLSAISASAIAVGQEDVIGAFYNNGSPTHNFNGYIQDLRITKGLARYTSNFTPPTAELEG